MKVLIVDDNIDNLRLAAVLLQRAGFEVLQATEGLAGVRIAVELGRELDAVIMDINLPNFDGLRATQEIRRHPEFQDLVIIAVSANVFPSTQARAFQAGVDAFITKPIQTAQFSASVAAAIARGRQASPPIG